MEQNNYREQHYKRTEERTKVNVVLLRFFLNALLLTIAGTVAVVATSMPVVALVALGATVSVVAAIICYVIWININDNIKDY